VTLIDVSENALKNLPNCLNKNEALVEIRASNNKIKKPPPKLADAPNIEKVAYIHQRAALDSILAVHAVQRF